MRRRLFATFLFTMAIGALASALAVIKTQKNAVKGKAPSRRLVGAEKFAGCINYLDDILKQGIISYL